MNSGGETPLHVAARSADTDTVRALVECGALLEHKDKKGYAAIELALCSGRLMNALALIKLGPEWISLG